MPKNIYDVFTDMKTEKSHKDRQVRSSDPSTLHVARLRHPPIEGSQVRTHAAPDLSEASRKKKLRVARKRGKLLRRWGSVVMGQVGPNVQMNVKM